MMIGRVHPLSLPPHITKKIYKERKRKRRAGNGGERLEHIYTRTVYPSPQSAPMLYNLNTVISILVEEEEKR